MYLFAQAFKETLEYGLMQSTLSEFEAHFLHHFNQQFKFCSFNFHMI